MTYMFEAGKTQVCSALSMFINSVYALYLAECQVHSVLDECQIHCTYFVI